MLSGLVNGNCWRREGGIGERAYGDGDEVGFLVRLIKDRGTASRAKMERDSITAVRCTAVLGRGAVDADPVPREPRLSAERASCPALAGQAMAHRNPDRVTLGDSVELPTAAGRMASRHWFSPACALTRLSYRVSPRGCRRNLDLIANHAQRKKHQRRLRREDRNDQTSKSRVDNGSRIIVRHLDHSLELHPQLLEHSDRGEVFF